MIIIDECLPRMMTQFFEKGNFEYQQQFINRLFGTVVIIFVSNRFNDLLHLKDKILKAVNTVSKGEIEHIS